KRKGEVLRKESDASPRGNVSEWSTEQLSVSYVRTQESQQDVQQRRLARPVRSEEPEDAGIGHGERDVVERDASRSEGRAVRLSDAAQLKNHGRSTRLWLSGP